MGICNCSFNGQVIVSSELKVPQTKEAKASRGSANSIHATNLTNQQLMNSPIKKSLMSQVEINCTALVRKDSKKGSKRSTLLMKYSMDVSQSQSTIEQFSRAQTQQSPMGFNNGNKDTPESSFKVNNREDKLFYYLKYHFLFHHFPSELLKAFSVQIKVASYDKGQVIPIDAMLLIKQGQIELRGEGKVLILSLGDTIGESRIMIEDTSSLPSLYTATALSKVEVNCISQSDYQSLKAKLRESNVEEAKDCPASIEDLDSKVEVLNKIYLFNSIEPQQKRQLASMMITSQFTSKTLFYSKRKRFKITPQHELGSQKLLFIVKSGVLSINTLDYTQVFEKDSVICMDQLLFFPNDKTEYEFHPKNECECFILPEKAFIETFGLNYRECLIHNYFDHCIKQSEPIISMLKGEKSTALFKAFSIKQYKPNEIVIARTATNSNTKYTLVLEGELFNSKAKNKLFLAKGSFYGDDCLYSTEELDFDIVSNKKVIVLESPWMEMKEVFKQIPQHKRLFEDFMYLSSCHSLSFFNEMKVFDLAKQAKRGIYSKGEIVLKRNTNNECFYMVGRGRIKLKDGNKTIRVYDEGSSFGELSLFNKAPIAYDVVASKNSICFHITQKLFFDLLEDDKMNDFIRHKMVTEVSEIDIGELYHLSYLGRGRYGNVCLVHNTISFYAAKAISKYAAEKHHIGTKYLLTEKKTMLSLDHPFIVKLVKTLKMNSWCFFLEEYIRGVNFKQYLDARKHKNNIVETKFYSAIIFLMLNYLGKNHIMHRDIKPGNIMLDSTGYLKLIDFGVAKKVKNFSYSVVGTPHFIAPEILMGKGYSIHCDYWSVGICIYYIYYGVLAFGSKAVEVMSVYQQIIKKEVEFPIENSNYELNTLLKGLLCKKPLQRINSFQKVQENSLFRNFNWDELNMKKAKPFYVPIGDNRDNPQNLEKLNRPFKYFMENESTEMAQLQTMRLVNNDNLETSTANNYISKTVTVTDSKWFEEF